MSAYYGYFRRCIDEPYGNNFVWCDFIPFVESGRVRPHYDILYKQLCGVMFDGMVYIKASVEQERIIHNRPRYDLQVPLQYAS